MESKICTPTLFAAPVLAITFGYPVTVLNTQLAFATAPLVVAEQPVKVIAKGVSVDDRPGVV